MLTWLKRYWIALVLIAFLAAILDATFSSLTSCPPVASGQRNECTALAGPGLTSLRATVAFLDAHGEAVTAFFTIMLAVFTGSLWYATQRLFEVTKIVADADRPHMVPTDFTVTGTRQPPDADGMIPVKFVYRFMNYGRSPAFMRQYSIRILSGELPSIPECAAPTATRFIIAVNSWWGLPNPPRWPFRPQTWPTLSLAERLYM